MKPLTSRPVNSEVYIIGKYFRGFDENPDLPRALIDRLAEYKTKDPCDWSPLIDPVFMKEVDADLLRASQKIHEQQQVSFLNRAMRIHNQGIEINLKTESFNAQKSWIKNNKLYRINVDQQLAYGKKIDQ